MSQTDTTSTTPGELLTETEAASVLRLKPCTLRAWRSRAAYAGQGPAFVQRSPGAPVMYLRSDLVAWIAQHRKTT